jgi:hypothetical protein
MKAKKHILEKSVKALKNSPFPSGPDRQTTEAALAALAHLAGQTYEVRNKKPTTTMERIRLMKPYLKYAVAACIVAATGITLYRYSGNLDGATAAYATVLENIRKAHSVAYTQRIICNTDDDQTTSNMINSAGVLRTDFKQGLTLIFDPYKDLNLTLQPSEKKAFINRYIYERKPSFNWLTYITEKFGRNGIYKGRIMFQGRAADLYEVDQPFNKVSVWVDPKTQLPVYSEEHHIPNSKRVSPEYLLKITDFGGTGDRAARGGGDPDLITIRSDFQWNIDVNDSLFSSTPPTDYNVTEITLRVSEPNGTEIAGLLKFYIEIGGPQFPEDLEIIADPNVNRPMLVKKFDKDGPSEKELDDAVQFFWDNIARAITFIEDRKSESNWFYDPNASVGDANAPVCWWKLNTGQGYRVIYGDLSIRDSIAEPNSN